MLFERCRVSKGCYPRGATPGTSAALRPRCTPREEAGLREGWPTRHKGEHPTPGQPRPGLPAHTKPEASSRRCSGAGRRGSPFCPLAPSGSEQRAGAPAPGIPRPPRSRRRRARPAATPAAVPARRCQHRTHRPPPPPEREVSGYSAVDPPQQPPVERPQAAARPSPAMAVPLPPLPIGPPRRLIPPRPLPGLPPAIFPAAAPKAGGFPRPCRSRAGLARTWLKPSSPAGLLAALLR